MPPTDDAGARARIRDVALRHLAERGAAKTTFRGIAADAGVSVGLVQHHFGAKEQLRAACDEYVLAAIERQSAEALDGSRLADPAYIAAAHELAPLQRRYLARTLVEGSPAAARLFDAIVRLTESYLRRVGGERPAADLRAQAAVFAAMKLGLAVFDEALLRVLGATDPARDGYPRIARAALDILSPQVLGAEQVALARAGLESLERSAPKKRGKAR